MLVHLPMCLLISLHLTIVWEFFIWIKCNLCFKLYCINSLIFLKLVYLQRQHLITNNNIIYCFTVISVSSFVEVVDTLDAEGPHLDILLVSVDPHIDKGMKMLKYISEEFQHIPVIISKLMLFDLQLVFSLFLVLRIYKWLENKIL